VPPVTPPTPYRDGKPLTDIIPPDHRRAKAAALVLASMIAGVTIWVLGGWVLEQMSTEPQPRPVPTTPGYVAGRIGPATLHGPGRDQVMPPTERAIIHVWLQGCQDCVPAFEAMRDLEDKGGLGVKIPIINVAYGEADAAWARKYRVDKNLVFDVGGASVVKPLGIGTFTTIVLDANGSIVLRDRPDRPGYRERVRAAVGPENLHTDPDDGEDPPVQDGTLDASAVERVVAAHRSAIKRRCWEPQESAPSSVSVSVSLTVGTDGAVSRTWSTSDNPVIAKCIETEVKTWRFPAQAGREPMTLTIPFKFVRQ
jgi:hypothetical protein